MRKNYLCKNLGIKKGGGSLLKGAVFLGTHGIILSLSLSLSLSQHVLTYCVHSLLGGHQIIAEEEM